MKWFGLKKELIEERNTALPYQPVALDGKYGELMEAFLTAWGFWPSDVGR